MRYNLGTLSWFHEFHPEHKMYHLVVTSFMQKALCSVLRLFFPLKELYPGNRNLLRISVHFDWRNQGQNLVLSSVFFNLPKVHGWRYYSQRDLKCSGAHRAEEFKLIECLQSLILVSSQHQKAPNCIHQDGPCAHIWPQRCEERTSRQTKYMLYLAFFFRSLKDIMIRQKFF